MYVHTLLSNLNRFTLSPSSCLWASLPAQDTQHQVEDEEGPQQNEGDKVDPGPLVPDGIVDLEGQRGESGPLTGLPVPPTLGDKDTGRLGHGRGLFLS